MARASRRSRRSRREHHGLLDTLLDGASDVVQSVANEVAPGVVGALDIDQLVQRLDVQAIVDRVDVQAVMDRVDLQELLERIDLNAVVDKLDIERILARVDVNALLQRVDINALVENTELGDLMARSGSALMAQTVDIVRSQGVGADSFVHRWIDRFLGRGASVAPSGPPLLVPAPGAEP